MTFTRMDEGKIEEWKIIGRAAVERQSSLPKVIKAMLLQLEEQVDGFAVSHLEHGLQSATRALRDGASEEMVVAALCHDIGHVISNENHGAIAAEIIKPFVSHETYQIVRTHQDFQARYYNEMIGRDPEIRRHHANEPWYEAACRFSEEWDGRSFDPNFDTLPLSHFEPMLERIFGQPTEEHSTRNTMSRGRRWKNAGTRFAREFRRRK